MPSITTPENGKLKGWSLKWARARAFCAATLNGRVRPGAGLLVLRLGARQGRPCGSAADPAVACCLCGQTRNLVTGEPGGVVEEGRDEAGRRVARGGRPGKARTQLAVPRSKDGDVHGGSWLARLREGDGRRRRR